MVRGAKREATEMEKGALMQSETEGKVEYLRQTITNAKDEGVDFIKVINDENFNYKNYNDELKKRGKRR